MFRGSYKFLMALALLAGSASVAYADALARIESVNSALAEELRDSSALDRLEANPQALEKLLSSRTLQQQVLDGVTSIDEIIAETTTEETKRAEDSLTRAVKKGPRRDLSRKATEDLANIVTDKPATTVVVPTTPVIPTLPPTDVYTRPADNTPPVQGTNLINLNAIPEGDYDDKDANGWPKFLKVPADCPAAQSGKDYYHEFRYSRNYGRDAAPDFGPHPGGSGIYAHKFISPVMNAGGTMQFNITDKEVYAVPFYTNVPQHGGYTRINFGTEESIGLDVGIDMVVMRCPGVFPDNEPDYQGLFNFTAIVDADGNTERLGRGTGREGGHIIRLKPNTRYFMNIKVRNGWSCTESAANNPLHVQRNGAPICVTLLSGEGISLDMPYTGQCLREGPFPIGYDNWVCGDQMGLQGMKRRYRCFDTMKRLPEARFEAVGTTKWGPASWVMGANKPLYLGMECVTASENNDGEIFDWDKMPAHHVCAQHSEGFIHEEHACKQVVFGQPLRTMMDKRECKWDATRGYYRWTQLEYTQAELYCNKNTTKNVWKNKDGDLLEESAPGRGYHFYLGEVRSTR